ncbi:hypothetical protein FB451DRAFT_1553709 [Mycena latifolia]|nr:hypothetical protein FB451DRAFT_1553709 [Mycena latifolia]
MSPEILRITAVAMNPAIEGLVTCKLSVGTDAPSEAALQSSLPVRTLQQPVVVRRGKVLAAHCTHHKTGSSKPEIVARDITFQDILGQIIPVTSDSAPFDNSDIILHIDYIDTLEYLFRLNPMAKRGAVQISMAKVNKSISGRGFHYIGLRTDGSTVFERRLMSAPYPQEFCLSPMLSVLPEINLQLCLLRRPFYIWPTKSVIKFYSLTAFEAQDILHAGPPEGVEHTFGSTPEITIRLQWGDTAAILDESAKMISRRTHFLRYLGRTRELLERIVPILASASEANDVAKSICQGLGQIYNILAKIEDWDDDLLELIEDMTRCLAYVEDIRNFASLEHFQRTLNTLEPEILLMGNLILKYPQHGFSFQAEMTAYGDLRRRFRRWNRQFKQGMGVESLKRLGKIQELVEESREFLNKCRNDILERIRPPGVDRARPISGCLEGTRESVFEQIDLWLTDSKSRNILWIKGFPGSGKTCISSSLVEKWADSSRFGSSFFFERDGGVFTAPSTLLRTIACALCRHPAFMDALVADLETRMIDFSTTTIQQQSIQLVEKPLQSLLNQLREGDRLVVIVDALDECGGLGPSRLHDRQNVLAAIARWAALSPLLRLVVTSRDEAQISEVLTPISNPLDLKLTSRQASRDIEIFLKFEFQRIARAYFLNPDVWPTQDEIRVLTKKARGLFVWAATLLKFVDQPGPQEILHQILTGKMNVEGDITDLYTLILEISFCPDPKRPPSTAFLGEFNDFVGGIVAATRPLEKTSPLFSILRVRTATAAFICAQLRSVMMEGGKYLRFSHQSFVDFMISESCPLIFRIIPCVKKRKISLAILQALNDHLRFDPSRFRSSFASNPKTPDLSRISRELSYACQVWGEVLGGTDGGDENILRSLRTFFETKFLFWLEVLSLIGEMSCALGQLHGAKTWIREYDQDLGVFAEDAIIFVETFKQCIEKSASHIYLSAITFTPESSRIHQTYSRFLQPYASVTVQAVEDLRRGRSTIPAPIIYSPTGAEIAACFEGHTDEIMAALFTSNGHIASASYDATIRFWAPSSGTPVLKPFVTHAKCVTSLASSKDGTLLVSGSRDGTASVWDVHNHRRLAAFAHDDGVTCVALSPTDAVIVTGSRDNTVKFWDISSQRESRSAFRKHTTRITGVAFVADDIVISSSLDGTIHIHDLSGPSELLIDTKIRIHSLAVAPTTRSILAGSDRCVAVWVLSNRNVPQDAFYLAEDSDRVESIAVHGSRIAAAIGKNVEIWDLLAKERTLHPLTGHKDTVTSVAFSEDGRRLVSGSLDRKIRVWDVGTETLVGFVGPTAN